MRTWPSRWAKSKAQQAAKDEELRKAQAKRDAAYDAERAQEARERQAEAERESEQVRSTEVDWEKFAALPADSHSHVRRALAEPHRRCPRAQPECRVQGAAKAGLPLDVAALASRQIPPGLWQPAGRAGARGDLAACDRGRAGDQLHLPGGPRQSLSRGLVPRPGLCLSVSMLLVGGCVAGARALAP